MERLGDSARRVLAASGVPDPSPLAEVASVWPVAVGDAIARVAWPKRLARDGTLHVSTVSATWAFELSRLAGEIQTRLARELGPTSPHALRFSQGSVPEPSRADPPPSVRGPAPTADDRREAERLASAIDDPALRELVSRAAAASLATVRDDRSFC
jgi:hypothetical protein